MPDSTQLDASALTAPVQGEVIPPLPPPPANAVLGQDIDIPHFDYPFTLTMHGAGVVEQDSTEEVFACIQAIVACPIGTREEMPTFGIPMPDFQLAPIRTTAMEAALAEWEPRAGLALREFGNQLDASIRHIHVDVRA